MNAEIENIIQEYAMRDEDFVVGNKIYCLTISQDDSRYRVGYISPGGSYEIIRCFVSGNVSILTDTGEDAGWHRAFYKTPEGPTIFLCQDRIPEKILFRLRLSV